MRIINVIQKILSGDALVSEKVRSQYKIGGLIALYIIIYIFLDYRSKNQQLQLSDIKKEVRDKKYEYLTISTQRTYMARPSSIIQALRENDSKIQENKKAILRIE